MNSQSDDKSSDNILSQNNIALYCQSLLLIYIINTGTFNRLYACDFRRLIDSQIGKHMLAIFSIFVLHVNKMNYSSIKNSFFVTLALYLIFMATTKSNLLFVFLIITTLLIIVILNKYINYVEDDNPRKKRIERAQKYMTIVLLSITATSFIYYYLKKRKEYGKNFSFYKFWIGTVKCKDK